MHPDMEQKLDSGYQGAQKLHAHTCLPYKKSKNHKLTKQQKQYNKQLAKERVAIEHINANFKVFKLLENRYRSHTRFGLRVTLIAALINANAA